MILEWQDKTVKTLINRLLKKEAIGFEKDGREYLYFPLLKESDYISTASENFLEKVFNGKITNLSLYGMLYRASEKGRILFLDVCDTFLEDVTGVNLLKAAMDTKPSRRINWESSSSLLNKLNVPTGFDFQGSVILISNISFGSSGGKIGTHLAALKDRSFTLTIANDSSESLFKQLCFMVMKKDLLSSFSLSASQIQDILKYVENNMESIPKISLRLAIKLAQLVKDSPDNWYQMANTGLLNQSN